MKLRHVIITVAVLGIAGLAVFAFRPRPILVDIGTVRRGPLQVTVDIEGKTRVRERHVVSSPLAGTLARPRLKAGDCVEANAVVAQLRPVAPPLLDVRTRAEVEGRARSAADAMRQAEANLSRARSVSELATREVKRARALAATGSISQDALERAEFDASARAREAEVAEHGLDVTRHDREVAQAALLQTRGLVRTSASEQWNITSPVTGAVLRILQESEAVVQPGTPLFELGDVGDLELIAQVLTTDAVAILPGAPVIVERWGGSKPLHARVRRVEPSAFTKISALGVEEQRVNVLADFEDPPQALQGLGDGYRVELRIVVADVRDALLVPVSATFRQGPAWAVFVLANGRARLRELKLGRRNETDAEVLGNASAGEQVVLYPGETLRDGGRVEPR
jgi:HlyD family secretion protein